MTGRHRILIQNKNLQYDFEVVRNITIIRGDSATGKTTLIDMIGQYERDGDHSGINLMCDKKCTVLSGLRWKDNLETISDSIVFIDENDRFIVSKDFAEAVKNSDNYYVLITRDNLYNLPYSVEEIYGIHASGRYMDVRKTYNELYRIYSTDIADTNPIPHYIIVEDSNSGYEFFKALSDPKKIKCVSAQGRSNIYHLLLNEKYELPLIIADGAAFGCEMNKISELIGQGRKAILYLPESFEWLILKSGLIDGKRVDNILNAPENNIESNEYFSWERYFTKLLTSETEGTYLHYSKEKLNDVFLHAKEKAAIINAMEKAGEIIQNID